MMIDINKSKDSLTLEGRAVALKSFSIGNITPNYIAWLNDPEVVKYSNQRFFLHNTDTCLEYFLSFIGTNNIYLAIYLKEENLYVGTMTVYISIAHETADIGILIGDKKNWGKGIGQEAWVLMVDWLIKVAKVRKVTGGAIRSNVHMTKIMVNSGMKNDGVRVEQELLDGKPQDIVYFAKFRNQM
jgi:RimJ/RimL family protein N-acetyltransferase